METVHSKLRRMESLLGAIPQKIQVLYNFKIIHTENDFVGFSFYLGEHNYIGVSADLPVEIKVRPVGDSHTADIKIGDAAEFSLYGSASFQMSHTCFLPKR